MIRGSILRAVTFGIALAGFGAVASAETITAQVQQSGVTWNLQDDGPAPLTPITPVDTPWDFAGTNYMELTSIDVITVTLTMSDGDTGVGDFDRGDLLLQLDGIDTGLFLNGFRNNETVTLTLSLNNPTVEAALLAALKVDGKLSGQVRDTGTTNQNDIGLPATFNGNPVFTTLSLQGQAVPLPSVAVAGAVLLGGTAVRRVRRRGPSAA